jgi:pimeloyl-ACP methyl ester carboxylesterase
MATPTDHHDFLGVPSPSNVDALHGSIGGGYEGADYRDPRTSSTQSLAPSDYDEQEKRKLLLIYIHGFMGNDNSFQNFPFHVHRFLRDRMRSTHAVHTKIYPRYKTYKAIEVARDNFSLWLEPHESPDTDVVLIGHSMGGLLAAEVALMASLLVPL